MMDRNNQPDATTPVISIWMLPMGSIRTLTARYSILAVLVGDLLGGLMQGQAPSDPPRPGVSTPGVRRSMADIHPQATFNVEGQPDWMVVTDDAVWVTSSNVNHVVRLDAKTNRPTTIVNVRKPCSGLAAGFGSIWVPSCGAHSLVRVDPHTGKIQAEILVSPADSEGGITVGAGSVWMASDKKGVLARIDPQTNKVAAEITIPSGSFAPEGMVISAATLFVCGSMRASTPFLSLAIQTLPAPTVIPPSESAGLTRISA